MLLRKVKKGQSYNFMFLVTGMSFRLFSANVRLFLGQEGRINIGIEKIT